MVLKGLLERDYRVDLITSKGGVLDELKCYPNLKMHTYRYLFSNNGIITMLRYIAVQLYTFFFALLVSLVKGKFEMFRIRCQAICDACRFIRSESYRMLPLIK